MVKNNQKNNIVLHIKITSNSNFSVHKVLLEHNHSIYILSMAAFALQSQSWVIATERRYVVRKAQII